MRIAYCVLRILAPYAVHFEVVCVLRTKVVLRIAYWHFETLCVLHIALRIAYYAAHFERCFTYCVLRNAYWQANTRSRVLFETLCVLRIAYCVLAL